MLVPLSNPIKLFTCRVFCNSSCTQTLNHGMVRRVFLPLCCCNCPSYKFFIFVILYLPHTTTVGLKPLTVGWRESCFTTVLLTLDNPVNKKLGCFHFQAFSLVPCISFGLVYHALSDNSYLLKHSSLLWQTIIGKRVRVFVTVKCYNLVLKAYLNIFSVVRLLY